ncbi:MAG: class II aldolase/adducin family protein [Candidatus Bathyarchaeum sp.]|nr:MAG: class II aldolase/adducin family protein [Candidatus Bathyarchaeum sp.]
MKEGKIRFNIIFVSDEIPSDIRIEELKEWSERFQRNGLTPEIEGNYTGNLSFRSEEGFVITASGLKSKENLGDDCFVYVESYDEQSNTVYVGGKRHPSSEAVMHFLIYKAREEVNAIFHGHNEVIIANAEKFKLPVTEREHEPGSRELANEVLRALGDNNLIVIKNHGFISLGKTMNEAGKQALATLRK